MRIRNIWNGREFDALATEWGVFSIRSGDPFDVRGFEVTGATQAELDELPTEWRSVVTVHAARHASLVSCACCGWEGGRQWLAVNAFHLPACPACYSSQVREGGAAGAGSGRSSGPAPVVPTLSGVGRSHS